MIRALAITLLFTLAAASALQAQEVRVVEGKKYLLHTVAQGQTLFAIGKHYAVPVDALLGANPGAASGLSIGQVLLVPQDAQVKKELRTAPALRNGELVHKVSKKETLFGLARRYGVNENALLERNPELNSGLKEGMEVVIPPVIITEAPAPYVAPAVNDGSRSHLVIAGETLYSLANAYGVSQEAISEANGGLPAGLRAGSYLRIPQAIGAAEEKPVAPSHVDPGATRKVALMLPFNTAVRPTIGSGGSMKLPATTDAAVQFYAGALLAVDSMVAQGMQLDLSVFDTGESPTTWSKLFNSDSVRGKDLYIGPFHRAAIENLLRVAGGAHVVCPSPQSNKVLLGHPSVSKVSGGRADLLLQMARYVAHHHGRDKVILCKLNIEAERAVQEQVHRQINASLSEGVRSGAGDTVVVVKPGKRDIDAVVAALDPARTNVLVVPTDDVEFVTALVGKAPELARKFKIVVFGTPAWTTMDNLSVQDLAKLNTHVPAVSFVDQRDPRTVAFTLAYRDRFKNEPGEYAFMGYDITRFYLTALREFGRNFEGHFAQVGYKPLHINIHMDRSGPENGWRNESAVMLQYKDMTLLPATR